MLIAHRGASFDAPENTLAAVRLAWEQGADAVEVDVRLSRDGRVVLLHDADTARTAGRRRKVRTQTLAELRRLDVGSHKGPEWAGEKVPTLDEVLRTVSPSKQLFVEIKDGVEILPALAGVLGAAGLRPEQVVLIGFDSRVVAAAKEAIPGCAALWLCSIEGRIPRRPRPVRQLIAEAGRAGLDGLDVRASAALDGAFVADVHAAGLTCYAWTVDDPAEARRLFDAGIDGLTTNRPGWLRRALERNRAPGG